MKNKSILKAVLLFILVLPFFTVAQLKADDTVVAEQKTTKPLDKWGFNSQIAEFDPMTGTFCIVNRVDNSADILKLGDTGYQVVARYVIDETIKRHDVENIFRPSNVFLFDNHVILLASNKTKSKIIVIDEQGNEVSQVNIPFKATDIAYDRNEKQFYVAGTNDRGYVTGFVNFQDGMDNLTYDGRNSLWYAKPQNAEKFILFDPYGIILAVISMSIVFLTLFMLFVIFSNIGRSFRNRAASKDKKAEAIMAAEGKKVSSKEIVQSGEELAAIATAIHLYYLEMSDDSDAKMTINRISKRYSPWSSKIYGLNNLNLYNKNK